MEPSRTGTQELPFQCFGWGLSEPGAPLDSPSLSPSFPPFPVLWYPSAPVFAPVLNMLLHFTFVFVFGSSSQRIKSFWIIRVYELTVIAVFHIQRQLSTFNIYRFQLIYLLFKDLEAAWIMFTVTQCPQIVFYGVDFCRCLIDSGLVKASLRQLLY